MQNEIKHIVIVRSAYPANTKTGYLKKRLALTRGICLESLKSQTNHNFELLVTIRQDDPLLADRKRLFAGLPFPVNLSTNWRAYLQAQRMPTLQTRLDDDDALAVDFIERLQAKADGPVGKCCWFSFPKGVRVHRGRYAGKTNVGNQFISLRTKRSDKSVFDIVHGRVTEKTCHRVDDRIAWLWSRHPESKSPGGKTRCQAPLRRLQRNFQIDWSLL